MFSLSDFAMNWCFPEYLILFWFASRSDYEIKDDRVAPGAPLLVIHKLLPQRGSHIAAGAALGSQGPPKSLP